MVDFAQFIEGIVHEPTQTAGQGFDLTVSEIYEMTSPGAVDFGGGELTAAERSPHDIEKRDTADEYGWWNLDAGQYLLAYNETLTSDDLVFTLRTRSAVLASGAFHPTLHVTDVPEVPLTVGGAGLSIKENARVSTLVAAEQD